MPPGGMHDGTGRRMGDGGEADTASGDAKEGSTIATSRDTVRS